MDTKKLFSGSFLSSFVLTPELLYFTNEEIILMEEKLNIFEQITLNPDIEKGLITKNELLSSYAISKAENSSLTLAEAQDVHKLIISNPNFNFLAEKIKNNKKLTQKDHDKLEFFNIAKTYRRLNSLNFDIKDLNIEFIKKVHSDLTSGLDIFSDFISGFTPYKSGKWRGNNDIRVDSYSPSGSNEINNGVKELVFWLKNNPNPTSVAIFHTALYALHPFNNGNKRVCRILEHLLLKTVGLNSKNLYSTSYYYHKEKERYYKYLLFSLERKNLNHFTNFVQEAITISMIAVVKTSLESKRLEFLNKQNIDSNVKLILKPLIKQKQIQFKNLFKIVKRKVSRQTFVNYLEKTVNQNIIIKKAVGRTTYYSLNFEAHEEKIIRENIKYISKKLNFIPDYIKNS